MRRPDLHLATVRGCWLAISIVLAFTLVSSGCGDDLGDASGTTTINANADSGELDTNVDDDSAVAADTVGADTAGQADGGEDGQSGSADIGSGDDAAGDATSDSGADATQANCPGDPTCACTKDDECDSGACILDAGKQVCAAPCVDDKCATGYKCGTLTKGDKDIQVCLPDAAQICDPCSANNQCTKAGGAKPENNACVDSGAGGAFCATACDSDSDCGEGYACKDAVDLAGVSVKQCLPTAGTCECSDSGVMLSLATACSNALKDDKGNSVTCTGQRTCTDKGLTLCNAVTETSAEVCDGKDNDCDGTADNGACDDDDLCTVDSCDAKAGKCVNLDSGDPLCCNSTKECDDAKCETLDFCGSDNKCQFKTAPQECAKAADCDDSNPCTIDACDTTGGCSTCTHTPKKGCCTTADDCIGGGVCSDVKCDAGTCKMDSKADGTACDDGSLCTTGETCAGGLCLAKSVTECDDDNTCTNDACTGKGCTHTNNGALCDDGDACNAGDRCKNGSCSPSQKIVCDDNNICTQDSCDPKKGCVNLPTTGTVTCDDGNPCTADDTCAAGQCKSTKNACDCKISDDCKVKDDQNLCNGTLVCSANKKCVVDAATVVTCKAGDDTCSPSVCNEKTGTCGFKTLSNGTPCDKDGSLCTVGDRCFGGVCTAGKPADCDDGSVCTKDSCDPKKGCLSVAITAAQCDDGDPCTAGESCQSGQCLGGTAKNCNDGNSCTTDTCDPKSGACDYTISKDGTKCDDGSLCSAEDACVAGLCTGKLTNCNDGNPCTTDGCDAKTGKCANAKKSDGLPCGPDKTCSSGTCVLDKGCTGKADGDACDDGDACTTGDKCLSGKCAAGTAKACNDGDACTTDFCDPASGTCASKAAADKTACEDGDACTTGDSCAKGKCVGGAAPDCNDGNACTKDACTAKVGCTNDADDNAKCDDGNACTEKDACNQGVCKANPKTCNDGDPCTTDKCDAKAGKCVNEKIAGCAGCKTDKDCDDSNACTVNKCDVASGQCAAPVANGGAPCDDNNACTSNDTCKGAQCAAGTPKSCDDGNPCTIDSCNKADGKCSSKAGNEGGQCKDADPCTVNETCASGKCGNGKPKNCNDGDPCTTDKCNAKDGSCENTKISGCTGCEKNIDCDDGNSCTVNVCSAGKQCSSTTKKDAESCDDGDACTVGEVCKSGKCETGSKKNCDDGKECTDTKCDSKTGCSNPTSADNTACEDGDKCTSKDTCASGTCKAGGKTNCDDGNACTIDSCDSKTGCAQKAAKDGAACEDGAKCTENDTCKGGKCVAGKDVCGGQCGNNVCDAKENCSLCEKDCGKCLTNADIWFSLTAASPGYLQGTVKAGAGSSYTQAVNALSSERPGQGGTLKANMGPLTGSKTYVTGRKAATSLRALFRTTEVHNDYRGVSVHVQLRDAEGRARIASGTKATLRIKSSGQPTVSATCALNSVGLCNISSSVPASWFKVGAAGAATMQVESGTLKSNVAPLKLNAIPKFGAAPQKGVEITLPNGPRLPGTSFKVPVYGYTQTNPLESFDIAIKYDPNVVKATVATIDSKYTGAKNIKPNEVLIVAVRQSKVTDGAVTGKVHIADITFQVVSKQAGAKGVFSGVINAMFNVQNIALVDKGAAIQVRSGAGTGNSGVVIVAGNPVRGIYAYADKSEVFNTARLNGKAIELPIVVREVRTALPDLNVAAKCTSPNTSVAKTTSNCRLRLDGNEANGAATLVIAVSSGTNKATVPFRVWRPGTVEVKLGDTVLQAVEGYVQKCGGSALRHQTTRVWAHATFSAGKLSQKLRVNHLVGLATTASAVASVTRNADGDWLRGVSAGKVSVRAVRGSDSIGNPALGGTNVTVSNQTVKVTGLDVSVATDLKASVTPAGALNFDKPATAVGTLVQNLNAEFKHAHVVAWAKMSDGSRLRVTEAMGLSVASLDKSIIEAVAKPPRVKAMGTGAGNLAKATWNVCSKPISTGVGHVRVALPPPTGGTLQVLQPRISWKSNDPATLAGVAATSGVKTVLKYKDGTSKDVTLDVRTVYDDKTGDAKDLFTVVVAKDKTGKPTKVTIVPTGKGVGKATLHVTFKHAPKIKLQATVNIVKHEKFDIDAHPWPAYPGSDKVSKTKLYKLEKTGVWQQAIIDMKVVLTDGHKIDVSNNAATKYVAVDAGTTKPNTKVIGFTGPKVKVIGAGKVDVIGSFGGASSAGLTVQAIDKPSLVTKLETSFPSTFLGIKDKKTQQLQVKATFDDGTVLLNALTVKGLLSFSSSNANKASINATTGLATLRDNHNKLVTLTAKAVTSGVTGGSKTATNLQPVVGDIDLGNRTGLAHPDRGPGKVFVMPVRVNTGGQSLGSIDVTVKYDKDVLFAVKGEPGTGWPGGQFDVTVNDPPGQVHIVAAAKAGSNAKGELEVAKLTFQAIKKGAKTETMIEGFITKLLENTTAQKPIGGLLGPGQTRAIVAGRGLLDPECAGGAKPADFRGNTNGDCEFSVGDVSYTLFYLAQLVKKEQLQPFQLLEMDADGDKDVDVADAVYLLRVLAGKFRFAGVKIAAPTTLVGKLRIDAVMTDKVEKAVDSQTDVYLHIGFKLNTKVKWLEGSVVKVTKDGVVVKATAVGNGLYRVEANNFTSVEKNIGVAQVIKTSDALGKTAADRQVALHGSPWLSDLSPYKAMATFDILDGKCTKDPDCNDGKLCTVDTCVSGGCKNTAKFCADNTPCTIDSCNPADGKCVNKAGNDGAKCNDGNACLLNDVCKSGKCAGSDKPNCDDKNACTGDSCDVKKGCVNTPLTASCDDNNPCTVGDKCGKDSKGGWTCAISTPKNCDDKNPCTKDSCGANGCVNTVDTVTKFKCYSGDPKTLGVGQCKAGTKTCQANGSFGACTGEVLPGKVELCDGKDNTCDGKVDTGCAAGSFTGRFHAGTLTGKGTKFAVHGSTAATSAPGAATAGKYNVRMSFYEWLKTKMSKGK